MGADQPQFGKPNLAKGPNPDKQWQLGLLGRNKGREEATNGIRSRCRGKPAN